MVAPHFRTLIVALALAAGGIVSASPLVTDIHAFFYRDLSEWEAEGLCDPAFMLRPYPPAVVKQMLQQVVERGEGDDRQRAEAWLQAFDGTWFSPAVLSDSMARADVGGLSYRGFHGPELRADAQLLSWLWVGGRAGAYAHFRPSARVDPHGEERPLDIFYVNADLTGAGTQGATIDYLAESGLYAGNEHVWFGAATTRASMGPFFDSGVVIGPQAPSTVNYTAQGRFRGWRISMGLFELVKGGDVPQAANKHAVLHNFSFSPSPDVDLGLFESIVFANRFDPTYLVPFGHFFLLQARTGYSANGALGDNSLAALYGTWRFAPGFRAKGLVFADDIEFADVVRGTLDTKLNLAAQAGLEWAPRRSGLRLLSAEYTLVMPYMFTHYYARDDSSEASRAINEQNNWTTFGQNWGPALLPNSDRLEVRARLGLAERLDLELIGRVIRHGNASAGVRNADPAHDRPGDSQDGGLYDDGWFYQDDERTDYAPSYQQPYEPGTDPRYARFLRQDVLEVVAAGGVGVAWRPRLWGWNLELSGRYLLEGVWNETVAGIGPVEGRDVVRHYAGVRLTYAP